MCVRPQSITPSSAVSKELVCWGGRVGNAVRVRAPSCSLLCPSVSFVKESIALHDQDRAMSRSRTMVTRALFALTVLTWLVGIASAVRVHDFKKCHDSSFCRRLRRLSKHADNNTAFKSPYTLSKPTFDSSTSALTARIHSALHPDIDFELKFVFHQDGTARTVMDQVGQTYKGWKRYNEAGKWAYEHQPVLAEAGTVSVVETDGITRVSFGPDASHGLEIIHQPFKATFSRNGQPQIVLNDRGLLHMEHFRPKPESSPKAEAEEGSVESDASQGLVFQKRQSFERAGHPSDLSQTWAEFEASDEGEWEESWSGRQDTKPKGPEALSLDISFPGKTHLFGLPEHASPLNLRSTRGEKDGDFTDPYRLMNTDVFEYDNDSPMALYGSVPVIHAQSGSGATSAFFLSGAETWIDVDRSGSTGRTHWIAESGILDLLVMLQDTPEKNIQRFTALVGRTTAPQTFALGYHQCRWNYLTDDDVLNVQSRFDEENIPMDVMWLDIEYSKDHMYGVWDELNFPQPEKMIDGLDERGRKLVVIIDPHLKRTSEYWLYSEAQTQGVLVKLPDGKAEYEGWCWSGSASWLDMFDPKATIWWKEQFKLLPNNKSKIRANRRNMHVWNDMNEPAIFNGPEVTSPKDVIHHGNWEHRDIHNINGILFQAATFLGLQDREGSGKLQRRPFVLSRAWWVGTQRFGAIWTGDNLGTWEHLAVSVPMILANNIAGMSFCGADIGGFFGNPSPEMLVRWYQAGIFEPFFRAHAHIDTKRREPYLLEEPYKSAVRDLIRLRYQMLPMWVTAFREAGDEGSGSPVLRPQFLMFPKDEAGFAIDDQYYIGDSGLLVKPAVTEGAERVGVYLADDVPYYNYFTHEVYRASHSPHKNRTVTVAAPLGSELPLLQRGGSILPLRERVRRSAELGWRDPLTLVIALRGADESGGEGGQVRAEGVLYLDDGQTYHYRDGAFVWRRFTFESHPDGRHTIRSRDETALRASAARGQTDASTTTSISTVASPSYDASNEFAQAIKDVRVEKIVVLGLEGTASKRFAINVAGALAEGTAQASPLSSVYTDGEHASNQKGKAGKNASRLVIKDPKALVTGDWSIDIVPA
ncbi:unnamed protein product [Parajaminaea phylloscopi]